ncbi:hypothetical protein ONS95_004579 [Cadophora gregata]|uniref:uncharacterized protein n=1 Tax=Cadophora gregata TaxID=51156 RepID=UPI0026DD2185|nr:uncharacterized protein ONS95_004579 [Cadophora gregata]KAK0105055.1 hypothetical protein ONS96_004458 [Cadophora gregata f. sp. sojae]KAK0106074.1 hypothetical protein ONS95_004579 [Cadophora gregata]
MSSTATEIGAILSSAIRVLRGLKSAEELISAWPLLYQKALQSLQTLSELEYRLFFDLPDEEEEAANLRAATTLSREQLVEKCISTPRDLTDKELAITKDRF